MLFDGRDITGMAPQRAARLGMARTFQIVQPFGAQTVRENIAVGAHLRLPGGPTRWRPPRPSRAASTWARSWTSPPPTLTVRAQAPELARALATRPRLLLLDEVLAG